MKPTLSPEDEALMREARAHWARMRDDPEGYWEAPISNNCALCCSYRHSFCSGCPVKVVTGMVGCIGIPFHDAHDRFFCMRRAEPGTFARGVAVLAFQKTAQRVIDWIDENLLAPASTLADEQQLPSEVTMAAEGEEKGS